jgi:hypothetical protein
MIGTTLVLGNTMYRHPTEKERVMVSTDLDWSSEATKRAASMRWLTAAQVEARRLRTCAACGKRGERMCRCRREFFCGKECQKAAWPEHKKVCSTRIVGLADDVVVVLPLT